MGIIIPFLYEIALDQDLARRPPRYDVSVLVHDFGGDMRNGSSYGFDSLDDWIYRRSLERHWTAKEGSGSNYYPPYIRKHRRCSEWKGAAVAHLVSARSKGRHQIHKHAAVTVEMMGK